MELPLEIPLNHHEKVKDALEEVQTLLRERRQYSYMKVFMVEFIAIAICSLLSLLSHNLILLNNIASIGPLLGIPVVFFAHFLKNRRIRQIVKKLNFEEVCYLQSALSDPEKIATVSTTKMDQLRGQLSRRDFIKTLNSSLDRLMEDLPKFPQSLEVFYQTALHYNKISFFQRMNPFRSREKEVLGDVFWAKIYCQAAQQNNQELMQRIELDYLQAKLGSNSISTFQEAINRQSQGVSLELQIENRELSSPIYQLGEQISLRMISLTRFFGKDLVLTLADLRFYLTKQIVIANHAPIAIGSAASTTFLGLSLNNLIPLSIGIFTIGLLTYGIQIGFRQYIRYQIKDKNLVDLMKIYHVSQDNRWLSMIHLKIASLMQLKSEERTEALKRHCPLASLEPFERRSLFFILANYIETHRGQAQFFSGDELSYEKISDIRNLCENEEKKLKKEERDSFKKIINDFLPSVDNKEQFEKFDKAIAYFKWQETLQNLLFPITTMINTMMSSLILFIPMTALLAASFVTIIPAASLIGVGLGLYIASKIVSFNRKKIISELDLDFMLTQSESPYFAKMFDSKMDLILKELKGLKDAVQSIQECKKIIQKIEQSPRESTQPKMIKYRDIALKRLEEYENKMKNPEKKKSFLSFAN